MADFIYKKELGYALPVHWIWVLLLSLLAAYLVFRMYANERGPASMRMRIFLASLRTLICVSILLSALNWHVINKKFRRPELILVFDSSISLQHLDEVEDSQQWMGVLKGLDLERPSRLNLMKAHLASSGMRLIENLRDHFELSAFRVGENAEPMELLTTEAFVSQFNAEADQSKIDRRIREILKQSSGKRPIALILFTDGIDSEDPEFEKSIRVSNGLNVPIFVIGLGEKKPAQDLAILDVQVNRRVFLNDLVEFQVAVSADGCEGKTSILQLVDEGSEEVVFEKDFLITSNQYRNYMRFRTRMKKAGNRTYLVRVKPVDGEFDKVNNQQVVQIEVVNEQINVLLAANYPSREFHYLKQFLGRDSKLHPDAPEEFANNRIRLKTFLQQADIQYADVDRHAIKIFPVTKKQLFEYDVVIFCDMKPNWAGNVAGGLGQNELDNLKDFVENRGGGVVFIAGPRFTPQAYSQSPIRDLFPVDIVSLTSPSDPVLSTPFGLRKTMEGKRFLPLELGNEDDLKPLHELEGTFWFASSSKTKPGAKVLAELSYSGKTLPAIVLQNVGNGSVVYQAFPESYRWRYRTNDIYFGRYWSQIIQYLASAKLGGDQGMFLETDRQEYFRQEPILILANVFDPSQMNERLIPIKVRNQSGFEKSLTLRKSNNFDSTYSVIVDDLGAGSYEVFLDDNKLVKTTFEVSGSTRESQRNPINESNLKKLAEKTGGQYLPVSELGNLEGQLPRQPLIESGGEPPWVLWHHWQFACLFGGLILGLCTLEWIVRKRCSML